MDVEQRGSKSYIKVDTKDPSPEVGEDELERNAVEMNQLAPPPPYEASGQQKLAVDVVVVPEDEPDGTPFEEDGCQGRCRCLRLLILLASVTIALFSVIFDWVWVSDIFKAYPALVFGPAPLSVEVTLCIVASLGTITFLWESIDKTKKYLTGTDWLDEELEDIGSLFLEEVPQVTLSLLLAMCREVPTSHFQMVKAGLVMASSGLRITRAFCVLLGCRPEKENRRQLRCFGWVMILIACTYTFVAGSCVFMYTYKPPPGELAGWVVPENILKKAYNTGRYFPNAGVFFSHPTIGHCDQSLNPTPYVEGAPHKSWFQVAGIYTFIYLGLEQLEASYAYNSSNGMFWVKSRHGEHCYMTNFIDCTVSRFDGKSCPLMNDPTIIFFSFRHMPETDTLVFGDIQFDGTVSRGKQCDFLSMRENGQLYVGQNYTGQLLYQRAYPVINTSLPVTHDINYKPRFYQYPQDLSNVTEAWKTGYYKCEMTGSVSPNQREDIFTKCIYKFGSKSSDNYSTDK